MTQPVQFPARQQRGLAKLAKLSLDFTINNTLDPRITFSRTSNATLVGPDGLIQYAPHNLLTYSEQFDNAIWTKNSATIIPNTVVSPDGYLTADKIVEGSGAIVPYLAQSVLVTSGIQYTYTAYLKSSQSSPKRYASLLLPATGFGLNKRAAFDLENGTYITSNSPDAVSMTSVGNGWYRCQVTATATTTATVGPQIRISNVSPDTLSGYTGDGTSGIYLWGAQLNEGELQPYYSTTVKNLLGYSQNFENVAWTKINSIIAASTVIGPIGFDGGEKLVENTVNASHSVNEIAISSATVGSIYTFSVYIKAAERKYAYIGIGGSAFNSVPYITVDLQTGVTAIGNGFPTSYSAIAVGNGWWRVQIAGQITTVGTVVPEIRTSVDGIWANRVYTGDGTSGIYIFGAQLSDSASLDTYSYNPVAAPTSTAYYGPRFDYDPVTLAPKGLLIEEQRTNLVLNSDALSTQSVTVTAQAYTLSFYGTGTITLSGTSTGSLVGTGAYPSRVSLTFTPTAGTLTLTVTGSVGYAQLEAGAFPTSYIPTTSATVTRAADNASMVGSNFSSWYNQSEGTVYAAVSFTNTSSFNTVYSITDGTTSNVIRTIQWNNGTDRPLIITTLGATQISASSTGQIGSVKYAAAFRLNDANYSKNGVLGVDDTLVTLPTVNQLSFGSTAGAAFYLNGWLQFFRYYPTRLPNGTLQGLTA